MALEKYLMGVGPFEELKKQPKEPGEYNAAMQAAGFGVPPEQLLPEVGEEQPTSEDDPRAAVV